jgi:hypothetical protein
MGNKTVVKHKIVDGRTACGRSVGFNSTIRGNKTWRGVTCQKCLKQKAKKTTKTKVTASACGAY